MSTLSASLLRPQRVRRAGADPDAALLADLLALLPRLVVDTPEAEALRGAITDALAALAVRLRAQAEAGLPRALERLRGWLDGLAAPLTAFGADLQAIDGPADAVALAERILGSFADLAGSVDAAAIRPHVQLLLDVLRVDLGVDERFVEAQVWALLDDAAARVRALPPGSADAMQGRRETVRVLHRLRRKLAGFARVPALDAARIAGELSAELRRLGAAAGARKAACAAEGLGRAAGAVGRAAEAVPFGGALSFGSLGAAAAAAEPRGKYAWYASWLLRDRGRPWLMQFAPVWGDEVWVSADRTRIERRNVLRENETLHTGTNLEWHHAPLFSNGATRFRLTDDPGTLEKLALVSAILADVGETAAHLASIEEGDWFSNALFAAGNVGHLVYRIVGQEPFPGWAEWLVGRLGGSLLASVQGIHTRIDSVREWFGMWLTLFGPDFGEVVLWNYFAGLGRDLVLASATLALARNDPDAAPPSENRKVVEEWTEGFTLGGLTVLAFLFPRRRYCVLGQGDGATTGVQLGIWVGGSLANGIVAGFWGMLVAALFSGDVEWDDLPKRMAVSARRSFTYFWPWLYLVRDGRTDDGRYNPVEGAPSFGGYPAKATSPYRMPYAPGNSCFVGQGNQGLWSHHIIDFKPAIASPPGGGDFRDEVYAYDFSLDADVEVLASRPGTVVNYFDWMPDNENFGRLGTHPRQGDVIMDALPHLTPGQDSYDRWNYVLIRHDVDDAGAPITPDAAHDRDATGAPVTTYCVYGHGRYGSVRDAFAALSPPLAPQNIIGTKVRRGQPIMRAGSTGTSFHNHVHVDVRPGDPTAVPPVDRFDLGQTIPFVYADCDEDDGRPRRLSFYTSANTRVP